MGRGFSLTSAGKEILTRLWQILKNMWACAKRRRFSREVQFSEDTMLDEMLYGS